MKFATTSGGECRFSVGCAVCVWICYPNGWRWWVVNDRCHCHMLNQGLTPSARVGVINGGINVTQVNFAHEAIDL